MIYKSLKPLKNQKAALFTLDIETDKKGELIDVGFYDGKQIRYFSNWNSFLKHLETINEPCLIYAHNGGGFDYVNLLIYLFRNGIKFEAMLKSSKIFCFWLLEKPHIRFVDSFNILPMSLEKITKAFSEISKLEINSDYYKDMRNFKKENESLYFDYLEKDCVSLWQAIFKVRELVNELANIGNLPFSIGGISMRVFKKSFLSEKILVPSKTEKNFTFNAYVGGRCEYLGFGIKDENNVYHNVNGYDFNSHYPAQMLGNEFPIRRGCYVNQFVRDKNGAIESGIYSVKYRQETGRIPLLQDCEGQYSFEGFGCFTHLELNEIEKNGGKVVCGVGYYYSETSNIFDDFVKFFFDRRIEAQKLSDSARDIFYKLVLNNLYGKFGQRDEVEGLKVLHRKESDELIENGVCINHFYDLDDENAFYAVKTEKPCYTSFPAIACMITASARIKLNQILESCKYPVYCDTDSIHCQDEITGDIIGDDLGKLKIEFQNKSARYGGKKSYDIIGDKFRQKGIPQGSINSEFFDKLIKDGKVIAEFNRPLLLKSSIRLIEKQSPSFFAPFTRTVTLDKSLKEKLENT